LRNRVDKNNSPGTGRDAWAAGRLSRDGPRHSERVCAAASAGTATLFVGSGKTYCETEIVAG